MKMDAIRTAVMRHSKQCIEPEECGCRDAFDELDAIASNIAGVHAAAELVRQGKDERRAAFERCVKIAEEHAHDARVNHGVLHPGAEAGDMIAGAIRREMEGEK